MPIDVLITQRLRINRDCPLDLGPDIALGLARFIVPGEYPKGIVVVERTAAVVGVYPNVPTGEDRRPG